MNDQTPDIIDPLYIKGFNQGYLLQKHEPDLTSQLVPALGASEQSRGFKAGRDEFIAEKTKSLAPDWLKDDPFAAPQKDDLDLDKDKDYDDLGRE